MASTAASFRNIRSRPDRQSAAGRLDQALNKVIQREIETASAYSIQASTIKTDESEDPFRSCVVQTHHWKEPPIKENKRILKVFEDLLESAEAIVDADFRRAMPESGCWMPAPHCSSDHHR